MFKSKALNRNSIKLILQQSSPIMVQFAISVASWEFFYILIEHHGTQPLAISNIMRNMFGIFGCFAWSFASASNSMVSNVIGQQLQHRVKELVFKIMKIALIFSVSISILINLFTRPFLSIYGQSEEFYSACHSCCKNYFAGFNSAICFCSLAECSCWCWQYKTQSYS